MIANVEFRTIFDRSGTEAILRRPGQLLPGQAGFTTDTNKILYRKRENAGGDIVSWSPGTGDLDPVWDAINGLTLDINTHVADFDNPHAVTKAQVGLGNVDNTSDANKPISSATSAALALKLDKIGGHVTGPLELEQNAYLVKYRDMNAIDAGSGYGDIAVTDPTDPTRGSISLSVRRDTGSNEIFPGLSVSTKLAGVSKFSTLEYNPVINRWMAGTEALVLDSEAVHKLGDIAETVTGEKTFTDTVTGPLFTSLDGDSTALLGANTAQSFLTVNHTLEHAVSITADASSGAKLTVAQETGTPRRLILSPTDITFDGVSILTGKIVQVAADYSMTGTGTELDPLSVVHVVSSGVISVPSPEWTLKTAPNEITIESCEARVYDNPHWMGTPKTYTIPAKDFTLVDGQDAMLIVHYNGGSPEYRIVNAWDYTAYNLSDTCLVYRFWWQFGEIHSVSMNSIGNGLVEKLALRLGQTTYYQRTGNVGLDLSSTASPAPRTVVVSEANVWAGPLPIDVLPFNSSTDKLEFISKNAGVWSETVITQWPNTYYNDNAGLVTLSTPSKWGVIWIRRTIGDTKECYVYCGTQEYTSEAAAASAVDRKDLPLMLYSHAMLVGRIIFQNGASTGTVQSAFDTAFSGVASSVIFASDVVNVPAGNISALTVQLALNELDTEKAPVAHAVSATTYGVGSATNYGHVKMYTSTGTSTDGTMDRNSITNTISSAVANMAKTNVVNSFTTGQKFLDAILIYENFGDPYATVGIATQVDSLTPGFAFGTGSGDFDTYFGRPSPGLLYTPTDISVGRNLLVNVGTSGIIVAPISSECAVWNQSLVYSASNYALKIGTVTTDLNATTETKLSNNGNRRLSVSSIDIQLRPSTTVRLTVTDASSAFTHNITTTGSFATAFGDAVPAKGLALRPYTSGGASAAIYNGGVVPDNFNYALYTSATITELNSPSTSLALNIANVAKLWVTPTYSEFRNTLRANYDFETNSVTAGLGMVFRQRVGGGTNACIYNNGVTPSASNYALYTSATGTELNGPSTLSLNIADASILSLTSTAITLKKAVTSQLGFTAQSGLTSENESYFRFTSSSSTSFTPTTSSGTWSVGGANSPMGFLNLTSLGTSTFDLVLSGTLGGMSTFILAITGHATTTKSVTISRSGTTFWYYPGNSVTNMLSLGDILANRKRVVRFTALSNTLIMVEAEVV